MLSIAYLRMSNVYKFIYCLLHNINPLLENQKLIQFRMNQIIANENNFSL